MIKSERGFSIDAERTTHVMKIRLWGRWNTDTGKRYLQDFQQKISTVSGDQHENWSILFDLTDYVLPPEEVRPYIEQSFIHLRFLSVDREAILLHGPIIHLPGQAAPQTERFVSSYFQSEDEALEWLME